jgi:hypothetical protein
MKHALVASFGILLATFGTAYAEQLLVFPKGHAVNLSTVLFDDGGDLVYGVGVVGLNGFSVHESAWFQGCEPDCGAPDIGALSLVADFTAGPLTHLTATFDPITGEPVYTRYGYSGGAVSIHAEWESQDGRTRSGTFSAAIIESVGMDFPGGPGVVVNVRERDWVFSPTSYDTLVLGPGTFSPRLARYLGVQQQTSSGYFTLNLEYIDGGPFSDTREGALYWPALSINAVAIPEPSFFVLGVVGCIGLAVRRCL